MMEEFIFFPSQKRIDGWLRQASRIRWRSLVFGVDMDAGRVEALLFIARRERKVAEDVTMRVEIVSRGVVGGERVNTATILRRHEEATKQVDDRRYPIPIDTE